MKSKNMELKINVAQDFTSLPIGRYREDGPISGEVFREDHLKDKVKKALDSKCQLIIDLSGMEGMNASFLEESFGGLIRNGVDGKAISGDQLWGLLKFKYIEPHFKYYIANIKHYIDEAESLKK